jgi:hypothetical protein
MTRVISLAIFDPPKEQKRDCSYTAYLPAVLRGYFSAYPGWEVWIYHDSSLYSCEYGDVLMRAHLDGRIKLIYAGECERMCEAMLWRMRPAFDPEVEWFATRDVDSIPQPRDYKCINAFTQTDKTIQVIHDSKSHSGLMGGMACYNAPRLRAKLDCTAWEQLRDKARAFGVNNYGSDQKWLAHALRSPDEVIAFPPKSDPRDTIAPHIGGAGPVQPVIAWYDSQKDAGAVEAQKYENAIPPSDVYRHVVLGLDTSTAYASFGPLTVLLWRVVAGYGSVVLCVGRAAEWMSDPRLRCVADTMRAVGAKVYWIDPRGRRTSLVAQVARLYAAALDINPNPYLMTCDLDMWPCDRDYFWQQPETKPWHQFFANASGHKFYPICYIGAKRTEWRRVFRISGTMEDEVHQALAELGPTPTDDAMWVFDEQHYTRVIKRIPNYREWWWELERNHSQMRRIDRSRWPANPDPAGTWDAHCIRPAHERWGELRPLFQKLAPGLVGWADEFISRYRSFAVNA